MPKKTSFTRLTPYLRGAIVAFALAGSTLEDIQGHVTKTDGSPPCLRMISDTIARFKQAGGLQWDGVVSFKGALRRSRAKTTALDKKILRFVSKYRGRAKVTAVFVQRGVKEVRKLNKSKRLDWHGCVVAASPLSLPRTCLPESPGRVGC